MIDDPSLKVTSMAFSSSEGNINGKTVGDWMHFPASGDRSMPMGEWENVIFLQSIYELFVGKK